MDAEKRTRQFDLSEAFDGATEGEISINPSDIIKEKVAQSEGANIIQVTSGIFYYILEARYIY